MAGLSLRKDWTRSGLARSFPGFIGLYRVLLSLLKLLVPPKLIKSLYDAWAHKHQHQIAILTQQRIQYTSGHVVGSKCNLKMHVRNLGYPLPPTNRGPKNHLFGDFAT